MAKVLIIGIGGVGSVVAKKCAMLKEPFSELILASRTKSKCDNIKNQIKNIPVHTQSVDADNTKDVIELINKYNPELVINTALPYQDLSIMDACLETEVDYLDTANYEPKDKAEFCYKWQWDYNDKFKHKNISALLGCGFDPGVTNIFCAYAQKHFFDEINFIDILDCNAGDHGQPFATNFNPEINIREITQKGKFWEQGRWIETDPLSVHFDFDYPKIGKRSSYLMYHEEMESLVKNINGLKRIRFWMTFSKNYLDHLRVLKNVGMTRIDPINYQGCKIVPLQFLKALLPEPSSLANNYKGKTCIGTVIKGKKDGVDKRMYIYNICDHQKSFDEIGAQAVSYTTGVPAVIGAKLMLENSWKKSGVHNVEEFDPDPFMELLNENGLKWNIEKQCNREVCF